MDMHLYLSGDVGSYAIFLNAVAMLVSHPVFDRAIQAAMVIAIVWIGWQFYSTKNTTRPVIAAVTIISALGLGVLAKSEVWLHDLRVTEGCYDAAPITRANHVFTDNMYDDSYYAHVANVPWGLAATLWAANGIATGASDVIQQLYTTISPNASTISAHNCGYASAAESVGKLTTGFRQLSGRITGDDAGTLPLGFAPNVERYLRQCVIGGNWVQNPNNARNHLRGLNNTGEPKAYVEALAPDALNISSVLLLDNDGALKRCDDFWNENIAPHTDDYGDKLWSVAHESVFGGMSEAAVDAAMNTYGLPLSGAGLPGDYAIADARSAVQQLGWAGMLDAAIEAESRGEGAAGIQDVMIGGAESRSMAQLQGSGAGGFVWAVKVVPMLLHFLVLIVVGIYAFVIVSAIMQTQKAWPILGAFIGGVISLELIRPALALTQMAIDYYAAQQAFGQIVEAGVNPLALAGISDHTEYISSMTGLLGVFGGAVALMIPAAILKGSVGGFASIGQKVAGLYQGGEIEGGMQAQTEQIGRTRTLEARDTETQEAAEKQLRAMGITNPTGIGAQEYLNQIVAGADATNKAQAMAASWQMNEGGQSAFFRGAQRQAINQNSSQMAVGSADVEIEDITTAGKLSGRQAAFQWKGQAAQADAHGIGAFENAAAINSAMQLMGQLGQARGHEASKVVNSDGSVGKDGGRYLDGMEANTRIANNQTIGSGKLYAGMSEEEQTRMMGNVQASAAKKLVDMNAQGEADRKAVNFNNGGPGGTITADQDYQKGAEVNALKNIDTTRRIGDRADDEGGVEKLAEAMGAAAAAKQLGRAGIGSELLDRLGSDLRGKTTISTGDGQSAEVGLDELIRSQGSAQAQQMLGKAAAAQANLEEDPDGYAKTAYTGERSGQVKALTALNELGGAEQSVALDRAEARLSAGRREETLNTELERLAGHGGAEDPQAAAEELKKSGQELSDGAKAIMDAARTLATNKADIGMQQQIGDFNALERRDGVDASGRLTDAGQRGIQIGSEEKMATLMSKEALMNDENREEFLQQLELSAMGEAVGMSQSQISEALENGVTADNFVKRRGLSGGDRAKAEAARDKLHSDLGESGFFDGEGSVHMAGWIASQHAGNKMGHHGLVIGDASVGVAFGHTGVRVGQYDRSTQITSGDSTHHNDANINTTGVHNNVDPISYATGEYGEYAKTALTLGAIAGAGKVMGGGRKSSGGNGRSDRGNIISDHQSRSGPNALRAAAPLTMGLMAADHAADKHLEEGSAAKEVLGSNALQYAGAGLMLGSAKGPVGSAVGAMAGFTYGLYQDLDAAGIGKQSAATALALNPEANATPQQFRQPDQESQLDAVIRQRTQQPATAPQEAPEAPEAPKQPEIDQSKYTLPNKESGRVMSGEELAGGQKLYDVPTPQQPASQQSVPVSTQAAHAGYPVAGGPGQILQMPEQPSIQWGQQGQGQELQQFNEVLAQTTAAMRENMDAIAQLQSAPGTTFTGAGGAEIPMIADMNRNMELAGMPTGVSWNAMDGMGGMAAQTFAQSMGQLSPEQLQNYDFAPLQSPQQMAAATAVIAAAPEYAEQYQGSGGIAQMMQQPEMRQIERVVSATEDEAVAHTNRMNIEGLANDQVDNLEQIRDILKSSGKREGE